MGKATATSARRTVTSAEILAATRKALLETNAVELSMRDVARQMGVAAGTVYSRFGTKDEVLGQVFLQRLAELTTHVEQLEKEPITTVAEVLRRLAPEVGDLKRAFDIYFEGFPGAGVRAETWQAISDKGRDLGRLIFRLTRSAAAHEGVRLAGGSIAERFVWSALVSVSTEKMAFVYRHQNSSYIRFMSTAILKSLAADDTVGRTR